MHMLGDDPRTMQDEPQYDDVVAEVCEYLSKRAAGLEASGIAHDRICLILAWFGQNRQADHRAYAQLPGVSASGVSHNGCRFPKELHRLRYDIDDPKERDAASAAEALMACELALR